LCWLVVALPLLHRPLILSSYSIANAIEHRRTLLPPSNATATPAIECRLYFPPLPQVPSIATVKVKCQRPPSSITTVKR
jgi:hypothetical protein